MLSAIHPRSTVSLEGSSRGGTSWVRDQGAKREGANMLVFVFVCVDHWNIRNVSIQPINGFCRIRVVLNERKKITNPDKCHDSLHVQIMKCHVFKKQKQLFLSGILTSNSMKNVTTIQSPDSWQDPRKWHVFPSRFPTIIVFVIPGIRTARSGRLYRWSKSLSPKQNDETKNANRRHVRAISGSCPQVWMT